MGLLRVPSSGPSSCKSRALPSTATESLPDPHLPSRRLVGVRVRAEGNPAGSRGIPGGNPREPIGFRGNTREHAGTHLASRGIPRGATSSHRKSRGMSWDIVMGPRGMPREPARSHANSHGIQKTHTGTGYKRIHEAKWGVNDWKDSLRSMATTLAWSTRCLASNRKIACTHDTRYQVPGTSIRYQTLYTMTWYHTYVLLTRRLRIYSSKIRTGTTAVPGAWHV